MGFEVGLGDLERGTSSNISGEGIGVDTATFAPSSSQPFVPAVVRAFYALKEKCSLKIEVFSKFKNRFQFPEGTGAHLPRKDEKACAFAYGEVCFYEAAFSCGLRFPVHPFIMKLLHYLNLAPGQLMPNSWRIVISCMVIWTIIADGDMLTVNEFVHLYRLKESKEFGYYEFVPWDRKSRLVADLPLSFRYWKSRYFLYRATVRRPFLMTLGGTSLGCCAGRRPLCLVHLLLKRCAHFLLFFLLYWLSFLTLVFCNL